MNWVFLIDFASLGSREKKYFSGDVAKHNFVGFRQQLKDHKHLRAWPSSQRLTIKADLL